MTNKIKFIAIAILISGFVLSVNAQKTKTAQVTDEKCVIEAWVEDKELIKDIFIHETPNTLGKVLGEIPFVMEDGEEPTVQIIGYAKGWLKIRKAVSIEGTVIFEGTGWIPAKRVTANVQRMDGNLKKGVPLYAKPSSSSKKIGTIPAETFIEIVGYDCFGLKVKYKNKTGWLSSSYICGNPVTTCS